MKFDKIFGVDYPPRVKAFLMCLKRDDYDIIVINDDKHRIDVGFGAYVIIRENSSSNHWSVVNSERALSAYNTPEEAAEYVDKITAVSS